MMFEEPKLIYIHMPKTGGSSVETYLNKCKLMKKRDGKMGQHAALSVAVENGTNLDDYKMFTVVRNTYERVLSIYCFFYVRGGSGFVRMGFERHMKDPDKKQFVSFPDYYTRLLELYRQGTPVTYAEDFFYYCAIDGKVPDNMEVLRFDHIEDDFTKMWREDWGWKMSEPFPHVNDNKNVPTADGLREYLGQDPKFIDAVNEIYEKEIEYFQFEPPYS